MRRLRFSRWAVVSAVALATSSVAIAGATSAATRDFHGAGATTTPVPDRPLETAGLDPDSLGGPESDVAYQHLRRTGAHFVRIMMNWVSVAPGGATEAGCLPAQRSRGLDVQLGLDRRSGSRRRLQRDSSRSSTSRRHLRGPSRIRAGAGASARAVPVRARSPTS